MIASKPNLLVVSASPKKAATCKAVIPVLVTCLMLIPLTHYSISKSHPKYITNLTMISNFLNDVRVSEPGSQMDWNVSGLVLIRTRSSGIQKHLDHFSDMEKRPHMTS